MTSQEGPSPEPDGRGAPSIGRLVVATRNAGKLIEIRHALEGGVAEVVGLDRVPDAPEVVEDGHTFAANASKKAREIAAVTGGWVLADDSGLEVDALGGEPGVFSARYADGDDRARLGLAADTAPDAANNAKLLDALSSAGAVDGASRGARFRAVLALAAPDGAVTMFEGVCEGSIVDAPRGEGGFGYDPLFCAEGHERTMAELALDEKNRISHRGRALARLTEYLADGTDAGPA